MNRKKFSKNVRRLVFNRLEIIDGKDHKIWREDVGGKVICFPSYGDMNSEYGWNIHHKNGNPKDNSLYNLEAVSFEVHHYLHNR